MKLLQQQLDAHEALSASLKVSPVRVSRVPAERDCGADEKGRQMTRRWQWLKAAEVGVRTHLVMIWDQEQLDPLVSGPPLLTHSNEDGDTALHRCAALGHQDCVEWLLERGADPELRNRDGQAAADLADAAVEHLLVVEPRLAPAPPAGSGGGRGAQLREIFARADRDGDGRLTRAELILRLRKDKELAELLNLPAKVGDGERDAFEAVFQGMDTDNSRGVSAEEFVGFLEGLSVRGDAGAPPPVLAPALARRTNRTPAPAAALARGRTSPLVPPSQPAMDTPIGRQVSDGAFEQLLRRGARIFDALVSQLREVIELEAVRPYVNGLLFQQLQSASPYGEIDKQTWMQVVVTSKASDPSSCSAVLDEIERAMRSQSQQQIRTNSGASYMTAGPEPTLMDAGWDDDESGLDSPVDYRTGQQHQHQQHQQQELRTTSFQVPMPMAPVPLDSPDPTRQVTGLTLQTSASIMASKDVFGGTEVYHQKDNICERSCFMFGEHGVVRRTCRKIIASRGPCCLKCRKGGEGLPVPTGCCEVSYFESTSVLLIA